MNALNYLEEESISIIRDTLRKSNNPLILYSIGKDSTVLLHLFKKALYPLKNNIRVLHVDTKWKFKEMIEYRDRFFKSEKINFMIHTNNRGIYENITPFNNPRYTDIMKTDALKQVLNENKFDFVYGGARRDEEVSRSKERILSIRNKYNNWDPVNQRIEPWNMFNTNISKEESFRVFPLSNWTEVNIWEYIKKEKLDVVPLYFAKKRKVVVRNNQIFLLDDERFKLEKGDEVENLIVRFRTLGCYPLTQGVLSNANTVDKIINELKDSSYSERAGRLIDYEKEGMMELRKKEGYF